MQHQAHLSEKDEPNGRARIVAILVVIAAIVAIGGYVVYGSGMWNPQVQQTSQ
ncbi:MAG: hypothetical protein ACREFW_03750 [Rhizomicrobium sp.]